MSVLSDLYKGFIRPEEQFRPELDELKAEEKRYQKLEEDLLSQMDKQTAEKVLRLLEERTVLSAYEMQDAYIQGMRMGARLTAELLSGENKTSGAK